MSAQEARAYAVLANTSELTREESFWEATWRRVSEQAKALFEGATSLVTAAVTKAVAAYITVTDTIAPLVAIVLDCALTVVTHLWTLCSQENSTSVKTLCAMSITTSLISFILNLRGLFERFGYDWSHEAATAQISEVASGMVARVVASEPAPSDGSVRVTPNADDGTPAPTVAAETEAAHELSFGTWLTLGVGGLVSIMFSGLGFSGTVPWKSLVDFSNVINAGAKTARNTRDAVKFILDEVCGFNSELDYPAVKELEQLVERGSKLQAMTAAEIVMDLSKLADIERFTKAIVKTTTAPMPKEHSARYGTVRQLLVTQYKQLCDKRDAVNVILSARQRQATVGLCLSGPPGHGKSELGKYLCKRVAEKLGYPDRIYSLNRQHDGFYEPYGGDAFGCYNEWMALREDDALLRDINLIFSTDPMNLEGAALECKNQPCRLKLGFLTSNTDNPDLVRVLNEGACKAVWDRLYHVHVLDPACRGRHHPNTHRRPDFSHLTFSRVDHRGRSGHEVVQTPMTMSDLLARLVGRCAVAERDYLNGLNNVNPEVQNALLARVAVLDMLIAENPPYDADPAAVQVNPNGLGREFFVWRFQGAPGTGKTTVAEACARELSVTFNMPMLCVSTPEEFVPLRDKPAVYILDDCVHGDEFSLMTLQKMNQCHTRSAFLVCTNEVFGRKRPDLVDRVLGWATGGAPVGPWDASKWRGAPGMLRRIGLEGEVLTPMGDRFLVSMTFARTFDFLTGFRIRDVWSKPQTRQDLVEQIFCAYRTYLAQPGEMVVVRQPPPAVHDPGISIRAPDVLTLLRTMTSKTKMMAAYMGRDPNMRIVISPRLFQSSASSTVGMWHVDEGVVDDINVVEAIFLRMAAICQRVYPGEALMVALDSGRVFYYHAGVTYIYDPESVSATLPIVWSEEGFSWMKPGGAVVNVSPELFARAVFYRVYDGPLATCTYQEYKTLHSIYAGIVGQKTPRAQAFLTRMELVRVQAERKYNPKWLHLEALFLKSPLFWIGTGLLVAIATGVGVYSLIKVLFCSPDVVPPKKKAKTVEIKEPPVPNSDPPTRVAKPTVLRKVTTVARRPNVLAPSGEEAVLPTPKAAEPNSDPPKRSHRDDVVSKLTTRVQQLRPNSSFDCCECPLDILEECLHRLETHGEHFELAVAGMMHWWQERNPGKLLPGESWYRVFANMLTDADLVSRTPSELETFGKALTESYVSLVTPLGSCYGIGLTGRTVLTVSHMFSQLGDACTVSSAGTPYMGKCVVLNRERDLAVVCVTSKDFPMLPNTRSRFVTPDKLANDRYVWMLRCGPNLQIAGGHGQYYDTMAYGLESSTPTYQLSEKFYVFTTIGVINIRSFIQRGDCGFPIVAPAVNNSYRILGIHNAYDSGTKAYFSSFTTADWDYFVQTVQTNADSDAADLAALVPYTCPGTDFVGLIPREFAEGVSSVEPTADFSDGALFTLGYSEPLNFRSRPRVKHRYVDIDELQTPVVTLPAAVSMDYVVDDSNLKVGPSGKKDPLWTQCVKYDCRREPAFDWDTFEYAVELVRQECRATYGISKPLRTFEVLNGRADGNLAPLDLSTSAGPCVKLRYKINTKEPLFCRDASNFLVFAQTDAARMVKSQYMAYRNMESGGLPPLIFSKDCAKVEMIDATKAMAGKVRLFNEVDLAVNLFLRRYFGGFQAQVMANHLEAPIALGQDPLLAATAIYNRFRRIDGRVVSTDFSAFDKSIPLELIFAFCHVVAACVDIPGLTEDEVEEFFCEVARSLVYVIHTCRGHLYVVDRGNESGTNVTTILNSVAVWILTYYTAVRRWEEIYRFTPTLSELTREVRLVVLGDDRVFKASYGLPVSQEDFVEDSLLFCLVCTPAKTGSAGEFDFCSRSFVWDEQWQVVYPALKLTSVVSQLHWYASFELTQVLQNLDNASFEAALHEDPHVFAVVHSDALVVARHFGISPEDLAWHSRSVVRHRFRSLVRGGEEIDMISLHTERLYETTTVGDKHVDRIVGRRVPGYPSGKNVYDSYSPTTLALLAREALAQDMAGKNSRPTVETNPVGAFLELLASAKCVETPSEVYTQLSINPPAFQCRVMFQDYVATGTGQNRKAAKTAAYRELFTVVVPNLSPPATEYEDLAQTARDDAAKHAVNFMYHSIKIQLDLANRVSRTLRKPVRVLTDLPEGERKARSDVVNGIRYDVGHNNEVYVLSQAAQKVGYKHMEAVYLMQPGTSQRGRNVTIGERDVVPNMDVNVQPATLAEVQDNPGATTIPQLPNPVPTTALPAPRDASVPVVSALEPLTTHTDLNPTGAPNMLSVGAVSFDLKDLVYSQFMDCDTQYSYTDDTEVGTIIFQIPYDPLSEFVNPYIRQYVSMHERYSGPMLFRVSIVGNATFSGLLAMSWQPKKIAGTVAKVSELMKYSYYGENIVLPSNKIMLLHDARRTQFYRVTNETTDVDDRPHLVCFVLMTAVSPLREGITIRIRIASKLSAGVVDGASPFQVALPIIPAAKVADDTATYGVGGVVNPKRLVGNILVPTVCRPLGRTPTDDFYLCLDSRVFARASPVVPSWDFSTSTWPALGNVQLSAQDDRVGGALRLAVLGARTGTATGSRSDFLHVIDCSRAGWYIDDLEDVSKWLAPKLYVRWFNHVYDRTKAVDFTAKEFVEAVFGDGDDYSCDYSLTLLEVKPPSGTKVRYYLSQTGASYDATVTNTRAFVFHTPHGYVRVTTYTCDFGQDEVNFGGAFFRSVYVPTALDTFTQVTLCESWSQPFEPLPSGWARLAVTADLPWVVAEGVSGPTLESHPSLLTLAGWFTAGLDPSQCLQLTLSDVDSGRPVVVLRLFRDRQTPVVNVGSDSPAYATCIRPASRLYVSAADVVRRTNTFPRTDLSNFVDNTVHPALSVRRMKRIYYPERDKYVTPNASIAAAIAGSAVSGIGSGLSEAGRLWWQTGQNDKDRELYRWLQENRSTLARELQANQFQFLWDLGIQKQTLAGYRTAGSGWNLNSTAYIPTYDSNRTKDSSAGIAKDRVGNKVDPPGEKPEDPLPPPPGRRPGDGTGPGLPGQFPEDPSTRKSRPDEVERDPDFGVGWRDGFDPERDGLPSVYSDSTLRKSYREALGHSPVPGRRFVGPTNWRAPGSTLPSFPRGRTGFYDVARSGLPTAHVRPGGSPAGFSNMTHVRQGATLGTYARSLPNQGSNSVRGSMPSSFTRVTPNMNPARGARRPDPSWFSRDFKETAKRVADSAKAQNPKDSFADRDAVQKVLSQPVLDAKYGPREE